MAMSSLGMVVDGEESDGEIKEAKVAVWRLNGAVVVHNNVCALVGYVLVSRMTPLFFKGDVVFILSKRGEVEG